MLGYINDCTEKLVIATFGVEAWHTIKQKAGCDVKDGEFMKLEKYTDQSTVDLVIAASEVSGLTVEQVLEAFGTYFITYIGSQGYDNLLLCQGSSLKDWANNINAIHYHLQSTFPNKMTMPEFWCEESEDGSLILYYHSKRGSLLVPVAKAVVAEVAKVQFQLDIVMERLTLQGENESRFTSWRISTKDPSEMYKLSVKKGCEENMEEFPMRMKCPFTGLTTTLPSQIAELHSSMDKKVSLDNSCSESTMVCPHAPTRRAVKARNHSMETCSTNVTSDSSHSRTSATCCETSHHYPSEVGSLSAAVTKKLFPYHTMVNTDLVIIQVGKDLPRVLRTTERELLGRHLDEVFEITKPLEAAWNWEWLRKLEDQSFSVEPVLSSADGLGLKFKTSIAVVNDYPMEAMLIMCPDANNLEELRDMNLTLSDLPVHGSHREAVFLREHLSTQMNNALSMEKLSKSLAKEKSLLESLLPVHAAEGLRMGRTVEPILHNNVTMFFSDVVGFTNICKQLYPWEVISMLNRLYCVMDHLSLKFNLFKVETIGDAYFCCSGLPETDEQHAENVANFAIAVSYCCQQVLSPLDQCPIQLRIGIHTGPAASGVVGVTNPRYCVFGDTVNTTARHESTGEPGKVHCSYETCKELERSAPGKFHLVERGFVDMKGKGQLRTFWLHAKAKNAAVNRDGLAKLDEEIKKLLQETNFDCQSPQIDGAIKDRGKQADSNDLQSLMRRKAAMPVPKVVLNSMDSSSHHSQDHPGRTKLTKSVSMDSSYNMQRCKAKSEHSTKGPKNSSSSTTNTIHEQRMERRVSIRGMFFL